MVNLQKLIINQKTHKLKITHAKSKFTESNIQPKFAEKKLHDIFQACNMYVYDGRELLVPDVMMLPGPLF